MLREHLVDGLLSRRSVHLKYLVEPGPTSEELELIIRAALRGPDHGGLHPWRVIEFPGEQREQLADMLGEEILRRKPSATAIECRRARATATRSPMLLGFVICPRRSTKIPVGEQWLAAGAALGNMLNAAHQLGYGATVLSGTRCLDPLLCARLGVADRERLAGFITIGRINEPPTPRRHVMPGEVWTCWLPEVGRTALPVLFPSAPHVDLPDTSAAT